MCQDKFGVGAKRQRGKIADFLESGLECHLEIAKLTELAVTFR